MLINWIRHFIERWYLIPTRPDGSGNLPTGKNGPPMK